MEPYEQLHHLAQPSYAAGADANGKGAKLY